MSHLPFWFLCGSSVLVELEFGVLVFAEGEKLENPEKYPPSRQDQQQIQPTLGTGPESVKVNPHWCEENALITAPFVLPLLTHLSSGCSCWASIEYPPQRSQVQNIHCVPRLSY